MRLLVKENEQTKHSVHPEKWVASVYDGPWYSDSDHDFYGDTREKVLEQAIKFVRGLKNDCDTILIDNGQ